MESYNYEVSTLENHSRASNHKKNSGGGPPDPPLYQCPPLRYGRQASVQNTALFNFSGDNPALSSKIIFYTL